MSENVEVQVEDQEFQLEPDNELRFEVENRNETVVLEVSLLNRFTQHTHIMSVLITMYTKYSKFICKYNKIVILQYFINNEIFLGTITFTVN